MNYVFYTPVYILIIWRNKIFLEEMNKWYEVLSIDYYNNYLPFKNNWTRFCALFKNLREFRSLVYYRNRHIKNIFSPIYTPQYALNMHSVKPIGQGLVIQHGHSTEINCASMGKNCQIWHNVTIGVAKHLGGKPSIGNNVKICANAVVIGDITIGDDVIIGAGAVVVKSIPPNAIAVGNPARILKK